MNNKKKLVFFLIIGTILFIIFIICNKNSSDLLNDTRNYNTIKSSLNVIDTPEF